MFKLPLSEADIDLPYDRPISPVKIGLCFGGALKAASVKEPVLIPAAPSPAIARPMMRTVDEGAMAQTRLPISKRKMARRKMSFRLKKPYALPPIRE